MLNIRMLKKPLIALTVLFVLCVPVYSHAFEARGEDCSKCHTLNPAEARELIKNIFPDIQVLEIRVSPFKGLWEIYSESGGQRGLRVSRLLEEIFDAGASSFGQGKKKSVPGTIDRAFPDRRLPDPP